MSKKLFKEKQQFRGVELMAFIVLLIVGIGYKLIGELLQPSAQFWLTLTISISLLLLLGISLKYLLSLRLKTSVNTKRISFSMPPLQKQKQKIKWEQVENCELVKTPIVAQWHGGNINFDHEKRYSLTGRTGIQITTKKGEKYFIGSRKPDALKLAIQQALGMNDE